MSIYRRYMLDESWGDEPEIKAQKSIIAALRKTLLTPADVKAALKKGVNPVDSSIEKWSRIQMVLAEAKRIEALAALEGFIGAKTYALCISSAERYIENHGELKDSLSKCLYCPLAKIQRCPDSDSIYSEIDQIVQNALHAPQLYAEDDEIFDRMKKLSLQMVNLLKSISRNN